MFLLYERIPDDELRESAKDAIKQIEQFFKDNPRRRVCRTELWYGKVRSIKKKDVATQINDIVEELITNSR